MDYYPATVQGVADYNWAAQQYRIYEVYQEEQSSKLPSVSMDIQAANQIFGPDIGVLKGKTTHQHPPILESPISKVLAFILQ